MGRFLAQMNPTESGVSECDLETAKMRRPRPTTAVEPEKGQPSPMYTVQTANSKTKCSHSNVVKKILWK